MKTEGTQALPWFVSPSAGGTSPGGAIVPFAPFLPELSVVGGPTPLMSLLDGLQAGNVGRALDLAVCQDAGDGSFPEVQSTLRREGSIVADTSNPLAMGTVESSAVGDSASDATAQSLAGGAAVLALQGLVHEPIISALPTEPSAGNLPTDPGWLRQETAPIPKGGFVSPVAVSSLGTSGRLLANGGGFSDSFSEGSRDDRVTIQSNPSLPADALMRPESLRLAQGIRAEVIPAALRELVTPPAGLSGNSRRFGSETLASEALAQRESRSVEELAANTVRSAKLQKVERHAPSEDHSEKSALEGDGQPNSGFGQTDGQSRRSSPAGSSVSMAASDAANIAQIHAPQRGQGATRPQMEADPVLSRVLAEQEPPVLAPQELPKDRVTRVALDADLSVEVTTHGGEVDVVLDGTLEAIRPLGDLGRELEGSLSGSGFSLNEFSMRERDGHASRDKGGSPASLREESQKLAVPASRVRRGSHVNRLA